MCAPPPSSPLRPPSSSSPTYKYAGNNKKHVTHRCVLVAREGGRDGGNIASPIPTIGSRKVGDHDCMHNVDILETIFSV